jgi:hypothetical protein
MAAGYSRRVYGHVGARTRAVDTRAGIVLPFKRPFLIDLLYTFLQGVLGAVAEEGGHSALTSDGLHIHASATFVPPGIRRHDYVSTQLAVGPLTHA